MADEKYQNQDDDYIEISIPQDEGTRKEERVQETQKTVPISQKTNVKKKVAKKKTAKKVVETKRQAKQHDEPSSNWIWVVLIIIGLLVIATVLIVTLQKKGGDDTIAPAGDDQIAALVNGQPIYLSQIDDIYNQLPDQMKAETSKEGLLDQFIDQELLIQEANKEGITVSQEEVIQYTEELKLYFGLTDELFTQALESQGLTLEEFQENNKKQIMVTKLINETVISRMVITDEEIDAYYNENLNLFTQPESVTVKHILLTPAEDEEMSDVLVRAEDLTDTIDSDFENFCDLVTDNSQDPGSIATCGEYAVAQNGQYVPEFEAAAFDMDIDEVRIVETSFGQHIMWKVSVQEASNVPLEDVQDQISDFLIQQHTNTEVLKYVEELRDSASIEKYPLDGSQVVTEPTTVEEEEVQEDQMEVTVEITEPVRQGSFGACLTSAGAVLYGVSWSPDSEAQVELLGDAFEEISYVDCDSEDCSVLGENPVYPTWIIDGQEFKGKKTVTFLSEETGCTV